MSLRFYLVNQGFKLPLRPSASRVLYVIACGGFGDLWMIKLMVVGFCPIGIDTSPGNGHGV